MPDYILYMPTTELNFICMEQNLLRKDVMKVLQLVLGKNQIIILFEVMVVFVIFCIIKDRFFQHQYLVKFIVTI